MARKNSDDGYLRPYSGKKRGPKPMKWTDKKIMDVYEMAKIGLNDKQIYGNLGISHDTFYNYLKILPELSEALEKGRSDGVKQVANALFEQAKIGQYQHASFYLKNRAGWRDTPQESQVSIGINTAESAERPTEIKIIAVEPRKIED